MQVLQVFFWWLLVQLLGLAALPLAFRALRWLPDRGYSFAKALGLLLTAYLLWLGASVGFLHNTRLGVWAALLLIAGLGLAFYHFAPSARRDAGGESLGVFLRRQRGQILTVEILFALAFITWAILRAYAPFKIFYAGGEKFMEIAFLNGVINSPVFPPLDPWMAGFAISYYYFGYVMMGLMTLLSGADPGVAFDLYDALLFALTAVGAYGIVYNLVAAARQRYSQEPGAAPKPGPARAYGLLAALFVVLLGNLTGVLEVLHSRGLLPPPVTAWFGVPGLADAPVTGSWDPGASGGWFWWWRGSRVIQDYDLAGNPLDISPISEFPFFSFLLGDNHPHVLALPFVLLAVGLALNLFFRLVAAPLRHKRPIGTNRSGEETGSGSPPAEFFENPPTPGTATSPAAGLRAAWQDLRDLAADIYADVFGRDLTLYLLYALAVGALGFLNTWDMPIYLGLVGLVYGAALFTRHRRFTGETVIRPLMLVFLLGVGAVGLYILFYLGFGSQAGGFLPYIFPPTRLVQYLLIFGAFIFILAWFLTAYLARLARHLGRSTVIRQVLRSWLWLALAVTGVFLAVLIIAALIVMINPDARLLGALGGQSLAQAFAAVILTRLANPWLFLVLTFLLALCIAAVTLHVQGRTDDAPPEEYATLDQGDIFVFLLIFVGLALTFITEIIYLRDSFGLRMNTVFKFYYQGWVLLALSSAYGFWWLLDPARRALGRAGRAVFTTGTAVLIFAGLVYTSLAAYNRVEGFQSTPNLNAASQIARDNPDDWAAIQWLRAVAVSNPNGSSPYSVPVILEAPGDNYKYEGRISAFTGLPAVLGWANHENQWRGSFEEQGRRIPDIETIYTTPDGRAALELLHKWGVDYVVVGGPEIAYIERLCGAENRGCVPARALQKFDQALEPVFQQGQVTVYRVPPAGPPAPAAVQ